MAGVTGLEPAASGVTGQRSNQLSYTPGWSAADRATAVQFPRRPPDVGEGGGQVKLRRPLRHRAARGGCVVGGERIELPTSWV